MSTISKLRDDHLRLLRIVRRLGAIIERRNPLPPLHLLALRHELSSTLIGHLKVEDWLLYPPLLKTSDAQVAATARAFIEGMGGLGDSYRAHCDKWSASAIAADWPGYCLECRQLLDELTNRITRENRDLYPLVESLSRAA